MLALEKGRTLRNRASVTPKIQGYTVGYATEGFVHDSVFHAIINCLALA